MAAQRALKLERMGVLLARLGHPERGLASVLGPLLMTTPPKMGSMSVADLQEQLRLVWRFRGLNVRGSPPAVISESCLEAGPFSR